MAKTIKLTPNPFFLAFLGHFFPHFGPWAIFYFSAIFSHFRVSARFHSIPGGLTRNASVLSQEKCPNKGFSALLLPQEEGLNSDTK